jgi:hypothetical protein
VSTQNLEYLIVVVAILAWIIYRQLTWQVVNVSRLWRMPAILAVIGVVILLQTKSVASVTPLALAILGGELLLTLAIGTAMGFLARFRSRPQRATDVRGGRNSVGVVDPTVTVIESRTGGVGAALWIVLIAVRVGLEFVVARYFPSAFRASTGTILLVLAANRAARAFVIGYRLEHGAIAAVRRL